MKQYRPEIDGLRAVAVIAVIFYHGILSLNNFPILSGGFLGVDIFFVISGYLITTIILQEIETRGTFSFLYFYERRARRILPALFFILIISLPFGYIFLLPENLTEFSKSLLYTLGFGSNYFFYFSGLIYGAENGLIKPLLHTWSLAVEEQYYFVFPLILLLLTRYFNRYILYILLVSFFTSLIFANHLAYKNETLNFYLLISRGWELLAGSLLAKLEILNKKRASNKFLNQTMPIFGFLLIAHGLFFYNDQMSLPSIYTLPAIIGVCLIIWFSNGKDLVGKILSTNLFVGVGLISYSLYLWHYPIFAFGRIAGYQPSQPVVFLIFVIIAIGLSISTFYLIEKPFRKKNNITLKKLIIILGATCVFLITINLYTQLKKGNLNKKNIEIGEAKKSPLFDDGICKFSSNETNFYQQKNIFNIRFKDCLKEKKKKFILIIGDSHGDDLFNSISTLSSYDFIVGLNQPSCRPITLEKCIFNNALYFAKQNKTNIRAILFTQKGSYMLTDISGGKFFYNSLYRKLPLNIPQIKEYLNYYLKLKKIVDNSIFVGPHIEPNISIDIKIYSKLKNKKLIESLENLDIVEVDNFLKKIKKINNTEVKYVSKIDQIKYNYKNDFFKSGKFMFSDADHWSESGEKYFGEKLFEHSSLKDLLN